MRAYCSVVLASLWLAGCSQEAVQEPNGSAGPRSFVSLHETSWTYTGDDGRTILETIDAGGNYISTAGADVVDRGTVKMVGGRGCFDSALSDTPPNCWEIPEVTIGETKEYTNNHGARLTVTRVPYQPSRQEAEPRS